VYTRAVRIVAILFAVGFIASSCAEPPASPTVPPPQAHRDRSDDPSGKLVKCSEISPQSTTLTIGRKGGTITAGPHSLDIPPRALNRPTEITMRVVPGRGVNAVHFKPNGLEFDRAAKLTMSYDNCDNSDKDGSYKIAYVGDESLNILKILRSRDRNGSITASIEHFSTYAVVRRDYVIAW
jgi:hypothetical protein